MQPPNYNRTTGPPAGRGGAPAYGSYEQMYYGYAGYPPGAFPTGGGGFAAPPAAYGQTTMYLPGYPGAPTYASPGGYRQPQIQTMNRGGPTAPAPAPLNHAAYAQWTPLYGTSIQRQTHPHQAQQVLYPQQAATARAKAQTRTRTRTRRAVGGSDDDVLDEDLLAASDDDDDYVPTNRRLRPTRAAVEARRSNKKRKVTSSEEEADVDSLDEDEDYPKKRQAVCVLDEIVVDLDNLVIDKVVSHQDDWFDPVSQQFVDVPPPAESSGLETPEIIGAVSPPPSAGGDQAMVEAGYESIRRYWIKWKGLCHLKNELCTYDDLVARNVGGVKKVQNYMKKQDEFEKSKLYCGEDEIEQINIAIELQRQLDADAQVPERIVTDTYVNTGVELAEAYNAAAQSAAAAAASAGAPGTGVPGTGVPQAGEINTGISGITGLYSHMTAPPPEYSNQPRPPARKRYYLVKWQASSYDQSTWETEEFLRQKGFDDLLRDYEARESRISGVSSADHPLNQHDLSETSFEPYKSTPFYMGSPAHPIELRDYQLTGVNWIISRFKQDLSVLLADEMGLGKTAQTICVVGHLLFVEKIGAPILLIVPQSTMDNWYNELRNWLPKANVVLYHGNPKSREIIRREEMKIVRSKEMSRKGFEDFHQPMTRLYNRQNEYHMGSSFGGNTLAELKRWITERKRYRNDIVITTPSIFQWNEDLAMLRSINWYLIGVDEAHQLKNRESKRFKELSYFKARYKLLLSGTPLHNNLDELWSLLHFMNPLIYQSSGLFKEKYSEVENTLSTGELKQAQLMQLQKELSNIILRRVKKDVLKSLPNKEIKILRVELSPYQNKLCQDVILHNYESLSKQTGNSKISLQNICIELKKICNHPFLITTPARPTKQAGVEDADEQLRNEREQYLHSLVYSSSKMCLLHKLLRRMKDKGHRVLIFSQMVKMLNILSIYLTLNGYKYQRLDGTMSRDKRKKAMDQFNAPGSQDFCFLLSTKAGGLGINLTSADTVIIYDSDWNPQNDLQAEARAHRIGQTKTVQIYRIVTKDSVEEDILERAKAKMVLDALVVQGLNTSAASANATATAILSSSKQGNNGFSREELAKILKFGATKLWQKAPAEDGAAAVQQDPTTDIDLDKVLAEAEPAIDDQDDGSRAGDLLNSYANVTDFRYEGRSEDKLSWDSVVPLEERLKFKEEEEEKLQKESAKSKPKTTRAKRMRVLSSTNQSDDEYVVGDDDVDSVESDEQKVKAPKTRRVPKKQAARTRRRKPAAAAPAEETILPDDEPPAAEAAAPRRSPRRRAPARRGRAAATLDDEAEEEGEVGE